MPNTINLRLLDNKNIIAELNGIPLAQENSYRIIAGEENATEFKIASKPNQYANARYTVEMVNAQGYGIAETVIIQDTFALPKGMAVAGYGWVQIRAYQGKEVVPFMTLKVKVWNTLPDWKEHISEGADVSTSPLTIIDNGFPEGISSETYNKIIANAEKPIVICANSADLKAIVTSVVDGVIQVVRGSVYGEGFTLSEYNSTDIQDMGEGLIIHLETKKQILTDADADKIKELVGNIGGGGGLTEEEKAKVDKLVIDGDGTKFLSDNGEYKEVDAIGASPTDVQINGTSIVENGIANIPYGSSKSVGVWKTDAELGTQPGPNGSIAILAASKNEIVNRGSAYKPIVPNTLDYAVKVGLTTNIETLSDTEKESACEWLGALLNTAPRGKNFGDGKLLGFNSNGKYTYSELIGGAVGNVNLLRYTIPIRDVNGVIHGLEPTTDTGLTNKKYVDDAIAKVQIAGGVNRYRHYLNITHTTGTITLEFDSKSSELIATNELLANQGHHLIHGIHLLANGGVSFGVYKADTGKFYYASTSIDIATLTTDKFNDEITEI